MWTDSICETKNINKWKQKIFLAMGTESICKNKNINKWEQKTFLAMGTESICENKVHDTSNSSDWINWKKTRDKHLYQKTNISKLSSFMHSPSPIHWDLILVMSLLISRGVPVSEIIEPGILKHSDMLPMSHAINISSSAAGNKVPFLAVCRQNQ